MNTQPMRRVLFPKSESLDVWRNSPCSSHICRWVEFDLQRPHVHQLVEQNEYSGIQKVQFQYILGEGEFKYLLLSTAGQLLERFTTLSALKTHAQFLLGVDDLMAYWDVSAY